MESHCGGRYRLTLKQTGGKELSVEVQMPGRPPQRSPLRLNRGSVKRRVVLQGTHLELIDSVETPGVAWGVPPPAAAGGVRWDRDGVKRAPSRSAHQAQGSPGNADGGGAVEVLGPLPVIAKSRIAYQQESGVALHEGTGWVRSSPR